MACDTRVLHFFASMVCSAMASPFGIVAAALAPVVLGFAKEIYLHFTRRKANAQNLAWVLTGAATFVLALRMLALRP